MRVKVKLKYGDRYYEPDYFRVDAALTSPAKQAVATIEAGPRDEDQCAWGSIRPTRISAITGK